MARKLIRYMNFINIGVWTASCWQKANRLSTRMTLFLLVLVDSKNVIVQLFAVMPCNVPIFEKQFQ